MEDKPRVRRTIVIELPGVEPKHFEQVFLVAWRGLCVFDRVNKDKSVVIKNVEGWHFTKIQVIRKGETIVSFIIDAPAPHYLLVNVTAIQLRSDCLTVEISNPDGLILPHVVAWLSELYEIRVPSLPTRSFSLMGVDVMLDLFAVKPEVIDLSAKKSNSTYQPVEKLLDPEKWLEELQSRGVQLESEEGKKLISAWIVQYRAKYGKRVLPIKGRLDRCLGVGKTWIYENLNLKGEYD